MQNMPPRSKIMIKIVMPFHRTQVETAAVVGASEAAANDVVVTKMKMIRFQA